MSNLKSAREIKLRNFVKDKLSLYSAKVSNLNSRNQSNAKCTKTNKIIKQNIITNMNTNQKEKEKNYINCNTKNLSRGKSKKNKKNFPLLLLQLKKKMSTNLLKYNSTEDSYNIKVINDIIYDEKKHIVSLFRNFLLWDETSDFLKRFYYRIESVDRLPRITGYYERYTLFSPVYFCLDDVVKIMLKNVKKKKKYLEMIEENEDNLYNSNNDKNSVKEFNYIINPKEINSSSLMISVYNNNVTAMNKTNNSLKDLNLLMNYQFKENDESESFVKCNYICNSKNCINLSESKSLFDITKEMSNAKDFTEKSSNTNPNTIVKGGTLSSTNQKIKKGKVIEIKKLDFKNINVITTQKTLDRDQYKKQTTQNTNTHSNLTERLKLANLPSSTGAKISSSKQHIVYTTNAIKQKPKTNLVIPQKTLINHITNINVAPHQSEHAITLNQPAIKFNSIENILRLIHYPKTQNQSSRMSSVSQSKTRHSKKIKTNLVIKTNGNNNSHVKLTTNKSGYRDTSTSVKKKNKSSNNSHRDTKRSLGTKTNIINNTKTVNSNTNNNNNNLIVPSSIYNINLNLNIGHSSNGASTTKNGNTNSINNSNITNTNNNNKKSINNNNTNNNTNNVISFSHNNSNSHSNQNSNKHKNNTPNAFHTAIIPKNKPSSTANNTAKSSQRATSNSKQAMSSRGKLKDKISYDLNLNNVHISIRKLPSSNGNTSSNGIQNGGNSNNINGQVNININCGHNSGGNVNEKKISRNENGNKNNATMSNLQSTHTNKGKHLVIPMGKENEKKPSKERKSGKGLRSNNCHENSVSLGKIRKKLKIEIAKKYPLTSRNEKESIPFELINKIMKKIK